MSIRECILLLFIFSFSFSQNLTATLVTVQSQNLSIFSVSNYSFVDSSFSQYQYTEPSAFETESYSFTQGTLSEPQQNKKPTIYIYEPKEPPNIIPFNVSFSVVDEESKYAYCVVFIYANLVNQTEESVLYGSNLLVVPTNGTVYNYTVYDPTSGQITKINNVEILCVSDYFAEPYTAPVVPGPSGGGGGGLPSEIIVGEIPEDVPRHRVELQLDPPMQFVSIYDQFGNLLGSYLVFDGNILVLKEGVYQFVFWRKGYWTNVFNIELFDDTMIVSELEESEVTITFALVPSVQHLKVYQADKLVRDSWVMNNETMGLDAGPYTFEFSREGYETYTITKDVREDITITSILKPKPGVKLNVGLLVVAALAIAAALTLTKSRKSL